MQNKRPKKQRNFTGSNRALVIGCICSVVFMLLTAMVGMIYFRENMLRSAELLEDVDYETYDSYYVLIPSDSTSDLWQSIYKVAREEGKKRGAYVEMLGSNLGTDYSREELLKIAIASDVDGIILEADDSVMTTIRLEEAEEKGIPVVTILEDNSQGIRKSFVGVSNYNLGREYGKQVLSIQDKEVKDVLVLMSSGTKDMSQNLIFSGIQETLAEQAQEGQESDIQVRAAALEQSGAFDVEESVRNIFMEPQLPDVIICLDEISTSCAYQAVVDYNMVGQIDIIGYYVSKPILKAIERNVLRSTIFIDTEELGRFCVEAMDEYRKNGYVSEYFGVGTNVITAENVKDYLGEEE